MARDAEQLAPRFQARKDDDAGFRQAQGSREEAYASFIRLALRGGRVQFQAQFGWGVQ